MRNPIRFFALIVCLLLLFSHRLFVQSYSQGSIKKGILTRQNYPSLLPEKIRFKHLTKENGLTDNFIWSVVKDRKGFIWIATVDGLNRYDGRKFKIFKNSPTDPNSLSTNEVTALCIDKSGNLWAGGGGGSGAHATRGGGGLNRYNPDQENFTRYINQDDSTNLSNLITTIFEARSGVLWIGTNHGGLTSFDREREEFITYKNIPDDPTSLSNDFIWTLHEDSKNNLWIGTVGGGLNKFNDKSKTFTRFLFDPSNPNTLRDNKVPCICEDKVGALWIGTYGGGISRFLYQDDQHPPALTHFMHNPADPASISGNDIDYMLIDENDIIWFGTAQGGLNRTVSSVSENPAPSFISYKHDPNDPSSLLGNNIPHMYKDDTGLFWIANYQEGLNIYDTRQKQFRYYRHEPNNPTSLSGGKISSIYEDKAGILWIGNWENGLNKWDRVTNQFTHYRNDPNEPASLSSNRVVSIYGDRSGDIWVGTYSNGLNRLDRRTGKFHNYLNDPLNPKSISENILGSIMEDSSSALWVATGNKGLNRFDRESESFTNINHNPDSLKILSPNLFSQIFIIDRSGNFWLLARTIGLTEYDPQKDDFVNYLHDPNNPNSLSSNGVTCVHQDKSGIYWIGTGSGGLNRYDKVSGQFKRYSLKDGLPSDWITEVLEDDSGNLWIGTNNGLSKFNPRTATFRNYTNEDGLLSNQIGPGCRSKTGELIFSSDDGFIIFHPDSIKDNPDIPPVYITDFYLFNKPVPIGYDSLSGRTILSKSIIECEEIDLNYDDKIFSFEFAALDYHAPAKNKYAYLMEGFDKDWTYVNADYRLITYTNLDPGKYIFRVKGSNNDDIWNETGVSVKIIIHPPWWQTSWAYLFYVLLIGSLVYFSWKAQLKKIRTRNEIEMTRFEARKMHEVEEMKSRFFTNISHEFRTPLTLILGPARDIHDSTNEVKTRKNISLIRRNANRLLGLVNQLLDISKLETGNIKLQTVPQNLVPLIKALTLSFISYAERKKITLKFDSAEDEIIAYIDKDKIEKIITNLLSNAFKFTPEGGRIEMSLHVGATGPVAPTTTPLSKGKYGGVEICITDTGIGIPPDKLPHIFDRFYQVDGSHTREQEGSGIGLALTKELVELHKGKIEVESVEGKGTTFVVTLPLGKDHLKPEEIGQAADGKEADFIKQVYDDDLEKRGEPELDLEIAEKESFPSLLIIEDNFDLRKYIKDHLQEGYRILEAGDGEDGWAQSLEHLPDLIISDVMMPKMDGFQLCQKLKMDERTSHIPVILLTAKAAKEDKLAGYETGADEYIMKPFEPVELRARIKNLLEQRNRLHEHFRRQGIFDLHQAKINPVDKIFLQKIYHEITLHISDPSFGVEILAENIAISRSVLHRKLVSLTGEPPVEFIRRLRLNRAVELMEKKFGNLSEIALEVGFTNPAYFSDCFRRQFGVSPSYYRRKNTIK